MRKTKQENTDATHRKQKKNAIESVVIFILLQVLSAVILLWCRSMCQVGWLRGLLLALAVLDLASILPSAAVLKQRMREIEGGELDAARKY